MHATDDHWFWWTTPSGETFWSQRHGRQRAGPAVPALSESHRTDVGTAAGSSRATGPSQQ